MYAVYPIQFARRQLAGFNAGPVLTQAIQDTAQYGSGWLVTLMVLGTLILLTLLLRAYTSQRSAAKLERLVQERTRQLEESTEQVRSLVHNAVVGIFRATGDGRIVTTNPALAKILCCTREGEILNRNLRNDIFVDPAAWDEIKALKDTDGWIEGVESKWMRCDGETATVRLSGRWVKRGDDEPVCELIVEDITALLNARVAEIEAERLRGVQKLAIAVAHEFNNPLSILLGTYQLYLEPNLQNFDPDVQDRLNRMPQTVSRMRDLVNRLLRISKLREDEYLHGVSYLNLVQSADENEELAPVDDSEAVFSGIGGSRLNGP